MSSNKLKAPEFGTKYDYTSIAAFVEKYTNYESGIKESSMKDEDKDIALGLTNTVMIPTLILYVIADEMNDIRRNDTDRVNDPKITRDNITTKEILEHLKAKVSAGSKTISHSKKESLENEILKECKLVMNHDDVPTSIRMWTVALNIKIKEAGKDAEYPDEARVALMLRLIPDYNYLRSLILSLMNYNENEIKRAMSEQDSFKSFMIWHYETYFKPSEKSGIKHPLKKLVYDELTTSEVTMIESKDSTKTLTKLLRNLKEESDKIFNNKRKLRDNDKAETPTPSKKSKRGGDDDKTKTPDRPTHGGGSREKTPEQIKASEEFHEKMRQSAITKGQKCLNCSGDPEKQKHWTGNCNKPCSMPKCEKKDSHSFYECPHRPEGYGSTNPRHLRVSDKSKIANYDDLKDFQKVIKKAKGKLVIDSFEGQRLDNLLDCVIFGEATDKDCIDSSLMQKTKVYIDQGAKIPLISETTAKKYSTMSKIQKIKMRQPITVELANGQELTCKYDIKLLKVRFDLKNKSIISLRNMRYVILPTENAIDEIILDDGTLKRLGVDLMKELEKKGNQDIDMEDKSPLIHQPTLAAKLLAANSDALSSDEEIEFLLQEMESNIDPSDFQLRKNEEMEKEDLKNIE